MQQQILLGLWLRLLVGCQRWTMWQPGNPGAICCPHHYRNPDHYRKRTFISC